MTDLKTRAEMYCDAQEELGISYDDSIKQLFLIGDTFPKKAKQEIIKELEKRKREKKVKNTGE